MKPLRLFTAFHGNLDFSALPDSDRALVIERCYWPLLSLPEKYGIPIGFEMSARTLAALEEEDPEWVKRFRGLAESDLVEPIASGWAQIVAPLTPTEINRRNLQLGRDFYRDRFGFSPQTYFIGEQTYSRGLASLYEEVGARQLIMEWNNPASQQPSLRPLRCQPSRLLREGGDSGDAGSEAAPIVLFNDSVVFQKVQRYAQGAIPFDEVEDLIERILSGPSAEALCLYGGDVEIFDYRPSRTDRDGATVGREMERLISLFRHFAADPRFEFVLPRDVVSDEEILPRIELASAADPIPCKKQPRYNPTRWCVSGRDGFGMNTRCHSLLRLSNAAAALNQAGDVDPIDSALVDLWRSDFRTRATEEKVAEFDTEMGVETAAARVRVESQMPELAGSEDLVLVNPWQTAWNASPVEVPLRLPVGRLHEFELRTTRGECIAPDAYQVEVSGRHRDGTIREATLVLEPQIGSAELLGFQFKARDPDAKSSNGTIPLDPPQMAGTRQVALRLHPHRGGSIARLCFPEVSDAALVGTIAHGTFDEIDYTPDFYSGHVVVVDERGQKQSDLSPVEIHRWAAGSGSVRDTLVSELTTPFGVWRKHFRLYHNRARLDVVHDLAFHEANLASIRLGTFTLLPQGWNRDALAYRTVNGGVDSERFSFAKGTRLSQSHAVSSTVSARSCLGASEGWFAFEDDDKRVLVETDRSQGALAPMLDFADVDDQFFCRLTQSAAETDETRATFMRGRRRFAFAIEGQKPDDAAGLRDARMRGQGLLFRTERQVGLTRSL